MRTVSEEALYALRHCQEERNVEAQILGQLFIEFEMKKREIAARFDGHPDEHERRMGSLVFEFERHKRSAMERIDKSVAAQKSIGDKALWSIHVNPDALDYTIDLNNGVVKVMRDGVYRSLE